MIEAIKSIVEIISSVFNFLIKVVSEIIYVIKLTGTILSNIASYFYFMPAVVATALITLITIAIAYKIAGRD